MNSASPKAPGITPALLTRVPSANPHVLSESASVLLDIVRFAAALFVVAGHLTLPELNTGFRDRRGLGEHAVPVFFVLSGFVIRFVTRSRPQSLRTFFIDRASRMYSVVLPAMGLTLLISLLCFLINPSHYLQVWGGLSNHIFLRVLLNITFLSQSWGHNTIPLINTPFWSLSYECLYYIAYGLLFYLRGWQRAIAVFLWAAVTGPQVLFLLPIWWLGCWVYDLYHEIRQRPIARLLRLGALAYLILGTLLDTTGHPALLHAPVSFSLWFGSLPSPLDALHLMALRSNMPTFASGLLGGAGLFLLLLLSDTITVPSRNLWARRFRRIADGTFAIYLMHYPLLVLALFVGLLHPSTHFVSFLVAFGICLLLILLAAPLDALKRILRARLQQHLPPLRSSRLGSA